MRKAACVQADSCAGLAIFRQALHWHIYRIISLAHSFPTGHCYCLVARKHNTEFWAFSALSPLLAACTQFCAGIGSSKGGQDGLMPLMLMFSRLWMYMSMALMHE